MFEKLLTLAATNAKLAIAAAAGAALVAGGGAVAIQNVASSGSETVTVTDNASDQGKESRSDTATAKIELPKPPKTHDGDKTDNHGRCVSEVARTKVATESGSDHGKRVSAAAKSDCGKDGATTSQRTADGDDAAAEAAEEAAEQAREAAEEAAEQRADAAGTDEDATNQTDTDESGSGNGKGRRP